jgi:hypothetical protein
LIETNVVGLAPNAVAVLSAMFIRPP